MQATQTLVAAPQARQLRRLALVLAAVSGLAAAAAVAFIEPVSDFLGEGPVRALSVEGGDRRLIITSGVVAATVIATWAASRPTGTWRYLVAAIGLLDGLLLATLLAAPLAAFIVLAFAVEVAGRVPRARAAEYAPRERPLLWTAGGVLGLAVLLVGAVVTVYLARPLFDRGGELDEALAFAIATAPAPSPADSGAVGGDAPVAATTAAGTLIVQGELMGADSFHTGSGRVIVVEGPDGTGTLRFEEYEVRNGPDLHVYVTPDAGGDIHVDGAVDLGEIKATRGNVNYELPPGLDLSAIRGAVIYCQPFGVVFATAVLSPP